MKLFFVLYGIVLLCSCSYNSTFINRANLFYLVPSSHRIPINVDSGWHAQMNINKYYFDSIVGKTNTNEDKHIYHDIENVYTIKNEALSPELTMSYCFRKSIVGLNIKAATIENTIYNQLGITLFRKLPFSKGFFLLGIGFTKLESFLYYSGTTNYHYDGEGYIDAPISFNQSNNSSQMSISYHLNYNLKTNSDFRYSINSGVYFLGNYKNDVFSHKVFPIGVSISSPSINGYYPTLSISQILNEINYNTHNTEITLSLGF